VRERKREEAALLRILRKSFSISPLIANLISSSLNLAVITQENVTLTSVFN
jgi:hypothetical protein